MKVYDKEIYKKQESISMTVILIVVFLLGFFTGYITNSFSNTEKNNVVQSDNITTRIRSVQI